MDGNAGGGHVSRESGTTTVPTPRFGSPQSQVTDERMRVIVSEKSM